MNCKTRIRRATACGLCCLALALALSTSDSARAGGTDQDQIHWKPVDEAQVKLEGKTPLAWNVYQPEKKKDSNLVLILLGHRYLALDIKARLVYAVFLADLHAQGKDFDTDNVIEPSRVIPSTEWVVRDIGPAESIKLTLGDYGRTLEIQLPHMPDLRRGIY
jgi:hypothetical protein